MEVYLFAFWILKINLLILRILHIFRIHTTAFLPLVFISFCNNYNFQQFMYKNIFEINIR